MYMWKISIFQMCMVLFCSITFMGHLFTLKMLWQRCYIKLICVQDFSIVIFWLKNHNVLEAEAASRSVSITKTKRRKISGIHVLVSDMQGNCRASALGNQPCIYCKCNWMMFFFSKHQQFWDSWTSDINIWIEIISGSSGCDVKCFLLQVFEQFGYIECCILIWFWNLLMRRENQKGFLQNFINIVTVLQLATMFWCDQWVGRNT